MRPPSGVYPARWQGPHRPIVATYLNGLRQLWLLEGRQAGAAAELELHLYPRTSAADRRDEIIRAAVGLYGSDRIIAALAPDAPKVADRHLPTAPRRD